MSKKQEELKRQEDLYSLEQDLLQAFPGSFSGLAAEPKKPDKNLCSEVKSPEETARYRPDPIEAKEDPLLKDQFPPLFLFNRYHSLIFDQGKFALRDVIHAHFVIFLVQFARKSSISSIKKRFGQVLGTPGPSCCFPWALLFGCGPGVCWTCGSQEGTAGGARWHLGL